MCWTRLAENRSMRKIIPLILVFIAGIILGSGFCYMIFANGLETNMVTTSKDGMAELETAYGKINITCKTKPDLKNNAITVAELEK